MGVMDVLYSFGFLYQNQPGGKQFRRVLSEHDASREPDWDTIEAALAEVERAAASTGNRAAA